MSSTPQPASDVGAMCSALLDRGLLNKWEEQFVTDMARLADMHWPLSTTQRKKLDRIWRERG